MRSKNTNSFTWLLEPIETITGYLRRPMFGCLASYLHGRLMVVLADREEPWSGILVPTSKTHHTSLMEDFPALTPHQILAKWLFLDSRAEDFEETAMALIDAIAANDPRIGVEPGQRKKRTGRKNAKKKP